MNISVCITTFNEESSIERLLDSLLNQTIKPDEIIIVDGGSKDKTCQIIKHYQKKDKRIKLLIEPGSIAHGRNISIEIAKGDIITSARSVAFKKQVWSEIGGFDEKLDRAGEDTKFFYEVVKRGVKIVRVKEARVEWEEIGNLSFKSSLKKLYYYAKGDAQQGLWLPIIQVSSDFAVMAGFMSAFLRKK